MKEIISVRGQQLTIEILKAGNNYSAYSPDVPGCIAAGDTYEETKKLMSEALEYHLHGFPDDDLTVHYPAPTTQEMPAMHV